MAERKMHDTENDGKFTYWKMAENALDTFIYTFWGLKTHLKTFYLILFHSVLLWVLLICHTWV